ncbi:MAG: hypothetical protein ACFFDW_02935, partial [Candidatus Thorarchaeota archaeon]
VQVSDPSGIDLVTLFYRIDSGSWVEVTMSLSGGNYTGEIPAVSAPALVEYYIVAYDAYDQVNSLGTALAPNYYEFTPVTTEDSAITYGIISIITITLTFVVVNKRRKVA